MAIASERLLLGLDLGGSAIKVVVISLHADRKPAIVARDSRGIHPSRAIGMVVDHLQLRDRMMRGHLALLNR